MWRTVRSCIGAVPGLSAETLLSALSLHLRGICNRRETEITLLCGLRLGLMAEERRRQANRDGDQVALDEIDELVQPPGDDLLDRTGAEDRAQLVQPFRDIIAAAQRIARFELGQRALYFAQAEMDRTREGRVEQQESGDAGRRQVA